MSALTELQQSLTPGAKIPLYALDLNPIGVAAIYYGTPYFGDGSEISFGGQVYTKLGIEVTNVERRAGENPEPRLTLPNTDKFASSLVYQHKDLVGAEVTRIETLDAFLDGRPTADANAILSTDIFVIEQKLNLNNIMAQFSLRVLADVSNRTIPPRVCMRDTCVWRYRRWNGSSFTYPQTRACPYVGTNYFDRNGTATTAALDDCSKDLPGCKLRFGDTGVLPIGAFPGMSKVRIS